MTDEGKKRLDLALLRVEQGWHMTKDAQMAMAEDARVLASEVRRLRSRFAPMSSTRLEVHGSVIGGAMPSSSVRGAMCEHLSEGAYRFVCPDFDPSRTAISIAIRPPWSLEMTAFETEICTVHQVGICPADMGLCEYARQVFRCPRYQAVVVESKPHVFIVNIWRAPQAPEDGSAATGETVLADADFDIQVVRIA